jgi:hypothetical protein
MWIFDRARDVRASYVEGMAGVEQWARIVEIRPGIARFKGFDLEIHWNGQPPRVVSTLGWVPRSVKPLVGQDVFYRESRGDDSTHYEIEWNQPPHYR